MKGDYYHRPRPYLFDEQGKCGSRTTMMDCMDAGLDPRGPASKSPSYGDYDPTELKKKLSRNTHVEGDGRWYGYCKRQTTPPRMPSPRSRLEKGCHYVSQVGTTLFPSESRLFETSTHATMNAEEYLDRRKLRSRQAGASLRPSFGGDPLPLSLDMPSTFSPYKGGRTPNN